MEKKKLKLVPLGYPSYPRRANFFYISLKNLTNRLPEEKNVGLTRLVTLAHYSLYKHFNLPSRVKKRRSARLASVVVSSCLGQRVELFSHINAAKVDCGCISII